MDRRISGRGDQGGARRSPSRYPGQFSAHSGVDSVPRPGANSRTLSEASRRAALGDALEGQKGIARAIYITATGMRIVVVHVFAKKTQKTPRKEIVQALKKAKEIL
ncbi:MAG: type II toxin-antitoxin system RelE/ParE family toxin [Terracidiphilus sp.]|nr:type II toxin-antitoxin system RelE/ParE family toxin [Terracidiphilus sp.]